MPLWILSFVPFNYCWKNKVQYFVITDGERWEVYDMKEMGGELITTANLSRLIRTR
jgi:predicted type IV restriction endonuclease